MKGFLSKCADPGRGLHRHTRWASKSSPPLGLGGPGSGGQCLRWNRGAFLSDPKERPVKGSSVGTRARFEILNNKPIQGLCNFFVRTIDAVSFSQTKVPARGNPWLFSIWEAKFIPLEFQAEAATADPEGLINALIRNRGLSPQRSELGWRFSAADAEPRSFQLWKLGGSSRENPSRLLLSLWQPEEANLKRKRWRVWLFDCLRGCLCRWEWRARG